MLNTARRLMLEAGVDPDKNPEMLQRIARERGELEAYLSVKYGVKGARVRAAREFEESIVEELKAHIEEFNK